MSRQSLTPFFKSTSNKRKLQGPDDDHETTVTKKMLRSPSVIFQGERGSFFPDKGFYLILSGLLKIIYK
jgi:hypothetical protein